MKHVYVRLMILIGCLHSYRITVADQPPVARVFLLAGQSNMEGQGVVDLDHPQYYNGGKGTLQHAMLHSKHPGLYSHLKDGNGQWVVRDDVFVRFQTQQELKRGGLSIGFSGYPGKHHIGPELQFGHVTGDAIKEPVLMIKTAWGGKSLYKDFRPPSAGGETGPYYRQMVEETRTALHHAAEDFPALAGHQLQLSGFVWMQGWNDMVDQAARAEYETNLVHLIHDIRAEFELPQLPVVIGELGNDGPDAGDAIQQIRNAQKAAAGREEFSGTVAFARTAPFARPAQESPNTGHGHHWYGNAESYFLIGDALGREMLVLLGLRPHADQNFVRWDTDANGRLTRDELPDGIRGNFDRIDSNDDGFISVQEHLEVEGRGAVRNEAVQQRASRLPVNVELQSDIPMPAPTTRDKRST